MNATPHLGYAFELVEADLAARARRALGQPVRFGGGTDDYSLKNVLAAEATGVSTRVFVDEHADRFAGLAEPLGLTFDDFIRTSSDPRHRPAMDRLWSACAANGDLYLRAYEGFYCVGCEEFYDPSELEDGDCPEHGVPAEVVRETNWFFRLSRYTDRLLELIETNRLLIDPPPFRREILAFIRSGLRDISVSRSVERARGWGIDVPGDPSQVVYVWLDALTNYISALDYGTGGDLYEQWWRHASERIHVVGKGIVRFHAIYWPAFLLSAGEPAPTRVHVHPYLTAGGAKLSKSAGGAVAPTDVVAAHGTDALRWWFARAVSPTTDTDFTVERLVGRANDDLANGIGNAVNRIVGLVRRFRDGRLPRTGAAALAGAGDLAARVHGALADFDRRTATDLVVEAVTALNRDIEATAPWKLAAQPGSDAARRFDELIDTYAATLRCIAAAVEPVVPQLAERICAQLATPDGHDARRPAFPRLEAR